MPDAPENREAGVALLMVMLGMIVMGVLALGIVLATRSGVQEANFTLETSEMQAFFDAVVLQVGVALLDSADPDRPRIDGVPQIVQVLGQNVPVSITSEFGKVDLNAAGADTLSNLFAAAGEGPAEANEEANQIVTWRTGGNGTQNIRLFRVAAEVTQVPGIGQGLYNRVASAVTVYSGRSRIDESIAPLLALEAMPGMDRLSALAIIHNRITSQPMAGTISNGQLAQGIDITGWAFTIEIEITSHTRKEYGTVVVRFTGDPARPYFILYRNEPKTTLLRSGNAVD